MLVFFSSGRSSSPFSVGDSALQTPSHLKFLSTFFCSLTPTAVSDILHSISQFWLGGGGQLHQTNSLEDCIVIFIWEGVTQGRKGQGLTCQLPMKVSHCYEVLLAGLDPKPDLPACLVQTFLHMPEPFRLSSVGLFLSFCPRTSRFLVSPRFSWSF